MNSIATIALDPAKFRDPRVTARGEERALVSLAGLAVLWFNTGTFCNLACSHCYIESSPRNDRLAYLSAAEVGAFLDEAQHCGQPVRTIGFTGGEPFLNREFPAMVEDSLRRGFDVLVLTNAMKPMRRAGEWLTALSRRHPGRLTLRVSLDHYEATLHDAERGRGTWQASFEGIKWLAEQGLRVAVAGRSFSRQPDAARRAGYAALFRLHGIPVDAFDPAQLVMFPEMDAEADVPEITTRCWSLLGKAPEQVMCATSRMVVKRKGAARPVVLACTLIAYDERFEMGHSLAEAAGPVPLNHPHCARFCVLGGASCGG